MKRQLIKLSHTHPELSPHISQVLKSLVKSSSIDDVFTKNMEAVVSQKFRGVLNTFKRDFQAIGLLEANFEIRNSQNGSKRKNSIDFVINSGDKGLGRVPPEYDIGDNTSPVTVLSQYLGKDWKVLNDYGEAKGFLPIPLTRLATGIKVASPASAIQDLVRGCLVESITKSFDSLARPLSEVGIQLTKVKGFDLTNNTLWITVQGKIISGEPSEDVAKAFSSAFRNSDMKSDGKDKVSLQFSLDISNLHSY